MGYNLGFQRNTSLAHQTPNCLSYQQAEYRPSVFPGEAKGKKPRLTIVVTVYKAPC